MSMLVTLAPRPAPRRLGRPIQLPTHLCGTANRPGRLGPRSRLPNRPLQHRDTVWKCLSSKVMMKELRPRPCGVATAMPATGQALGLRVRAVPHGSTARWISTNSRVADMAAAGARMGITSDGLHNQAVGHPGTTRRRPWHSFRGASSASSAVWGIWRRRSTGYTLGTVGVGGMTGPHGRHGTEPANEPRGSRQMHGRFLTLSPPPRMLC